MAVAGLIKEYLEHRLALHELSPLTARNARCALRAFAALVDEGDVETLTRADVELWLKSMHDLAPATRRTRLSTLRRFVSWLIDEGHIASDPTKNIRGERQPKPIPRSLQQDDVARVLDVCPDTRARAIVWAMVGEGLRCAEVAALEIGDWDRRSQVITVNGKGRKQRQVTVTDECAAAFEEHLAEWPVVGGPMFRSYRHHSAGLKPDSISRLVGQLCWAAGIKHRIRDGVSAHAFRHTCASDVMDKCNDIRVVQEMLGHEDMKTTQIYLRRAGLTKMREAMAGRRYAPGEVVELRVAR